MIRGMGTHQEIRYQTRMIFHHLLMLSDTHTVWKNMTGVVIPKPHKDDYTNPWAFRIISLTSNF